MIKLFELWTRRPDMTHDEAVKYWQDVHVPLVKKTLGKSIVKYVTNIGIPYDARGWSAEEAPPYDGIAEFWLDMDMQEFEKMIKDTADVLQGDEKKFIGRYETMFVEEVIQKDNA